MRIPFLLLTSVWLLSSNCLRAQFQLEWMYERQYGNGFGTPISCKADHMGGVFLASQTEDTVCFYAMGEIIHISSTGGVAWKNSLYNETPCLQQDLYSFDVAGKNMYYSLNDTANWMVKADTSGIEQWKLDTNSLIVVGDLDRYERITAFNFGPYVICFDSSGQRLWDYTDPYVYPHQIRRVISDKNGNRNVFYEFNDGSQVETRGVGIFQLDSNGVFRWDTIINPQTNPDPDLLIDVQLDNMNNSYVLSKDIWQEGCYLTRIDENGNITANNQFVPNPVFRPTQLEIDTIHGLVYVAGITANNVIVLKYDLQLNALDTMSFSRVAPYINVIGINEYGYLYHLWVSDSTGSSQLRLELYNHLGQLQDVYTYWDSTLFSSIYPYDIVFDSIGNIFAVCTARNYSFDDECLVFKFTNALFISEITVDHNSMTLFPNPGNENITISITGNHADGECDIYNATGQLMSTTLFVGNTCLINTQSLAAGLYFVEAVTDLGEHITQKLIIQHP